MTGLRTYDVCIIGSGVAGALLATEAAKQGRTVALLEAGDRIDFGRRLDLLRRYQTLGGLFIPWEHPGRDAYVDSSEHSIGFGYELERYRIKAVGGTTLHWGGRINRLMPSDFLTASTYGLGTDWPITYAELEPYYSAAEWKIGVSGMVDPLLPARSREFPMPAFPYSVDEQALLPFARRMGISVHPTPFAINSVPYNGRASCMAFAACNLCPSGARYSADFHVTEAEQTGRCELFTRTVARRIDLNPSGEVTAVHATTLERQDLEFRAKVYVIAAHAVESARLLLLSNCGNHSDQVGRHFMEHAYVRASGHIPNQRFYPRRVGFEKLETLFYYDGKERRSRGAIKLEFTFNAYDPFNDMETNHLWGKAAARYDKERFGHWLGINAETEIQAKPDSRISLDPMVKDLFGDPVPHVHLAFDDIDRRTQRRGMEIAAELLHAAGAQDIQTTPAPGFFFAAHHMGTCRMSDTADSGVVDRNCRVHGTSNLYVAGSSVFPTASAMQPTLTIAALSLRLAEHLMRAQI